MEEILNDFTTIVDSFMNWLGSTEPYGQYWIMLYIVLPACAWALIVWVSMWIKGSQHKIVRVVAFSTLWLWLITSGIIVAYVVAWHTWYAFIAIHWIELSGGATYGWGHNWPLPMWVWVLFGAVVVVACVVGLEQRKKPPSLGLNIFWWRDASAILAPEDDTLTDLPVVYKV